MVEVVCYRVCLDQVAAMGRVAEEQLVYQTKQRDLKYREIVSTNSVHHKHFVYYEGTSIVGAIETSFAKSSCFPLLPA